MTVEDLADLFPNGKILRNIRWTIKPPDGNISKKEI
jgi:hypothetical protein